MHGAKTQDITSDDADDHPIRVYLRQYSEQLLGFIRAAIIKLGLNEGEAVELTAYEILSRTVIVAIQRQDQFDWSRQPSAWLMGIANNIVKQYRREKLTRNKREITVGSLNMARQSADATENSLAMFDVLATINPRVFDEIYEADPETLHIHGETETEEHRRVRQAYGQLSEDDQQILRLAVIKELDGAAIAASLGVKPVAARVRLHRAIQRLSALFFEKEATQHE